MNYTGSSNLQSVQGAGVSVSHQIRDPFNGLVTVCISGFNKALLPTVTVLGESNQVESEANRKVPGFD